MKKNLYQALRDGLVSIDETMPEIRGVWCAVRDGVWAYIRYTLIAAALIIGGGMIGGLIYGALNPAHAATYDIVGDMQIGERICGRADPVLDPDPAHVPGEPGSAYIWLDRWRVTTCDGHNPAVSCPAGLIQWHHMLGDAASTTQRDYVCVDLSVPPQPLSEPRLRPCYTDGGAACWGVVEYWQGDWYGTWHPAYLDTPGHCPGWAGVVTKNVSYGHPPGVGRVTCAVP